MQFSFFLWVLKFSMTLEMGMIRKNVQNVSDSVNRLTNFFIGVLCLNAVIVFTIMMNI